MGEFALKPKQGFPESLVLFVKKTNEKCDGFKRQKGECNLILCKDATLRFNHRY